MIHNLLTNQDVLKLRIFQSVTMKDIMPIQELMTTFDLSRTSVKRYILCINQFLNLHFVKSSYEIKQNQSFHFYLNTSNYADINHIYYEFQYSLLQKSFQFQILKNLLTNSSVTLLDLSSELFISKNNCYKIIKQLNNSIAAFNISLATRNNTLSFVGSEQNIRFMYSTILFTSHQNINWPFHQPTTNFIHQLFASYREKNIQQKALSTSLQMDFHFSVIYSRYCVGHFIQPFNKISSTILQIFMDSNDITESIPYLSSGSPRKEKQRNEFTERQLFNLFIRLLDSEIDDYSTKLGIANKLLLIDNPVTDFHTKLNTEFINTYFSNNKEVLLSIFMYYTVLYHTFSFHYSFSLTDLINTNRFDLSRRNYEKSDFSLNMTKFCENFIINNPTSEFSISPSTIETIGLLHYSLFSIYTKNTLYVYVHYSKSPIGNNFIKSKINNVFNSDSLQFTSDIDKATIIVSDAVQYPTNNSIFFFMEDLYSTATWRNLYQLLQTQLIELYDVEFSQHK